MLPSGRIVGRPLKLLFPLETSEIKNVSNSVKGTQGNSKVLDDIQTTNNSVRKSQRRAAKNAIYKIKQML